MAVDPGLTVGAAYLRRDWAHDSWQVGVAEAIVTMKYVIRSMKPDLVVVERFQITPDTVKKTRQYDALEVIGALRYECLEHDVPFELQVKNAAFKLGNTQRLCALGWYRPGKEHANVASGHLALALVRHSKLHPDVTQRVVRAATIGTLRA